MIQLHHNFYHSDFWIIAIRLVFVVWKWIYTLYYFKFDPIIILSFFTTFCTIVIHLLVLLSIQVFLPMHFISLWENCRPLSPHPTSSCYLSATSATLSTFCLYFKLPSATRTYSSQLIHPLRRLLSLGQPLIVIPLRGSPIAKSKSASALTPCIGLLLWQVVLIVGMFNPFKRLQNVLWNSTGMFRSIFMSQRFAIHFFYIPVLLFIALYSLPRFGWDKFAVYLLEDCAVKMRSYCYTLFCTIRLAPHFLNCVMHNILKKSFLLDRLIQLNHFQDQS